MATPDLGTVTKSLLPSFSANVIMYVLISILAMALIGWGFWALIRNSKYNLTFVIYKDIAGKPQVTDRVKGMEVSVGNSGERAFFIKKYNKWLPMGNLQMGSRIFYYYIDKSGRWHNWDISHIDVGKRDAELNMQLNMDYARDGINKRLEDRKTKASWWNEHGWQLVQGTMLIILVVFVWLAFKDALSNSSQSQANLQKIEELQIQVTDKYTNLLVAMDNVCAGNNAVVQQLLKDGGGT